LDFEGPQAQNTTFDDVEILVGKVTNMAPPSFQCAKFSIHAPNKSYRNLTCNPQNSTNSVPAINTGVYITNTIGGVFESFHIENATYLMVLDNGTHDAAIINLTTSNTLTGGVSSTDMVVLCANGSAAPCSGTGNTSSNVVLTASEVSPNTSPFIRDDVSGRTITAINTYFQGGIIPPVSPLASFGSCSPSLEGLTVVASDCSGTVCSAGGGCTGGGKIHCQVYCNSTAWVETGM
jgi:hypothetical protein